MPEKISSPINKKIQQFCNKISVTYDLDDAIQKELFNHMEDKILDYLNEEVTITEEDAFVLVREHFGDPIHIKKLLKEVHGAQAKESLIRRIGAVLAATIAVELLHPFVRDLYYLLKIINIKSYYIIPLFISDIALPLLLWFILVKWQKGIVAERNVWFQRIKPSMFIGLLVFLLFLKIFVPYFSQVNRVVDWLRPNKIEMRIIERENYLHWVRPAMPRHTYDAAYDIIKFSKYANPTYWFTLAYIVLLLTAWLWWCDIPQMRFRSLIYALVTWIIYARILPLLLPSGLFKWNSITNQVDFNFRFYPIRYVISWNGVQTLMIYFSIGTIVLGVYILMTKYHILETRTSKLVLLRK
ncbi:MAG: hypothetical protein HOC71_15330 [Candidatus Latescibacteria bacterium]|jgi:hypothetical protein|nr:hypothetical protein [Candidatus Latescibacterota bacterium]